MLLLLWFILAHNGIVAIIFIEIIFECDLLGCCVYALLFAESFAWEQYVLWILNGHMTEPSKSSKM
jgi:hypothetical protein